MTLTNIVLLLFGTAIVLRGAYGVIAQDIADEGERMTGHQAVRHGVVLIVLGAAIASHALFEWPWVNAAVRWMQSV